MTRSLWIIGLDAKGNYVRPRRVTLPIELAAGNYGHPDVSDLQLTELHRELAHELARRRAKA
jgi:hypothetical protein